MLRLTYLISTTKSRYMYLAKVHICDPHNLSHVSKHFYFWISTFSFNFFSIIKKNDERVKIQWRNVLSWNAGMYLSSLHVSCMTFLVDLTLWWANARRLIILLSISDDCPQQFKLIWTTFGLAFGLVGVKHVFTCRCCLNINRKVCLLQIWLTNPVTNSF